MTLVWESEPWWAAHAADMLIDRPWWRVKRSENNPALLAYYQSAPKAERDIWTQIKPGRYLAQAGVALTPKQIKYWAEWQAKGVQPVDDDDPGVTVLFATTPDEIEEVYTSGPHSCMSGPAQDYDSPEHPTRIYGAGDLAIAYLPDPDDSDNVIARAICWPERKVFGRVYPTIDDDGHAETLRTALHALDYQSSGSCEGKGLDGARMLRIEYDNTVVCPYLDSPYQTFDDDGDYLILRRSGKRAGTDTTGRARLAPEDEFTCDNCEEGFNEGRTEVFLRCNSNGGYRSQCWCEVCAEYSAFTCEGFDETFDKYSVDSAKWNGETYTQAWLDANTFISDYSGERFSDDDMVTMHNGDVWSEEEFADYGQVLDGKNWPNDDVEIELERRAAAETTGELAL